MIIGFLFNIIVKGGVVFLFDNFSEYGLEYEDVIFKIGDGLIFLGWLVKGGIDKIII